MRNPGAILADPLGAWRLCEMTASMLDSLMGPYTLTERQLSDWGERIGRTVAAPVVIALRGELGAGKSVLARAIARGAGVAARMPSPTFNLMFRYPSTRGPDIVHLDLYRIERPEELRELGWTELPTGDEIVLIEWPEHAGNLLPSDRWDVNIHAPSSGLDVREVDARPAGTVPPLPSPFPRGWT